MHLLRKEEIQSSVNLLNVDTLFIHVVLQNELLKEKECPLMINSLANLYLGSPQMWRVGLFAIVTLKVANLKNKLNYLLQIHTIQHFFLNGCFDANTTCMRLCPYETRINHLYFLGQATHILQAVSQHLSWLGFECCPWRPLPSITLFAIVQSVNQRNTLGDVNLFLETLDARVTLVRCCHDTAKAAANFLSNK